MRGPRRTRLAEPAPARAGERRDGKPDPAAARRHRGDRTDRRPSCARRDELDRRELGLHCTAAGKVFLAFGAAELPGGELERLTPATITGTDRLDQDLEATCERGYATIVDELAPGLSALAAPVRDRGCAVIAALTASGASVRRAPQRLRLLGRVTLELAQALSARLGHDGSRAPT